jgi:diguanylate cyclase (GGDEF)-like protein
MRRGDPTSSTPRSRRGRVLIVGELPELAAIAERLAREPLHVGSVYEAIGEIYAADAAHPIDAVLIADRFLGGNGRHAAEAMRRVDPAVRLIRVLEGGEVDDEQAAYFDGTIRTPADLDALGHVLGPDMILDETLEVAPPPTQHSDSGSMAADGSACDAAEQHEPSGDQDLVDRPHVAAASPVSEEQARSTAEALAGAPPNVAEPAMKQPELIGDTDLIDAVLHDPNGVGEKALAAIAQHTGWSDVALVGPGTTPPAEGMFASVQSADREFGMLMSSQADPDDLVGWAQWLARWLQLDASYREYRLLAYRDDLTGAWNRRYLFRFLERTLTRAAPLRRPVTVMAFDIDDFKRYNDQFSHEAGDVILRETVMLMKSVIRSCDRVCRIGGDEFAVVFADLEGPREPGSEHPASVEAIAKRFQQQICAMRFPKLGMEAKSTLSISAGLATYPWDGHDPMELLRLADRRALESKRRGKNDITFGPGVADVRPEDDR